jgi:hypothetical protein
MTVLPDALRRSAPRSVTMVGPVIGGRFAAMLTLEDVS